MEDWNFICLWHVCQRVSPPPPSLALMYCDCFAFACGMCQIPGRAAACLRIIKPNTLELPEY